MIIKPSICEPIGHTYVYRETSYILGDFMAKKTFLVMQIAATYIGTVVGAGFASGQSIMQFFTKYGAFGTMGIFVVSLLFIWIGTKMMVLAHRIRAFSYQELNNYLFGPAFGKIANGLTFVVLFGVTAVMLSGTGSIFEEQLGLPGQLGIMISIIWSYWVMTKDMKGIMAVNSWVTPLMLLFIVLVAVKTVGTGGEWKLPLWPHEPPSGWNWVVSPLTYAALNFAFVQAVMVPLGSEVKDESALRWGGFWGGAGLGVMMFVSHAAIYSRMPGIMRFDIPMAEIIRDFGTFFHIIFVLVIYGEIFTTLIGNVFGITRQIRNLYDFPRNGVVLAVLLVCFAISQAGFPSLVTHLYPLFGSMGLILLVFLSVKRIPGN